MEEYIKWPDFFYFQWMNLNLTKSQEYCFIFSKSLKVFQSFDFISLSVWTILMGEKFWSNFLFFHLKLRFWIHNGKCSHNILVSIPKAFQTLWKSFWNKPKNLSFKKKIWRNQREWRRRFNLCIPLLHHYQQSRKIISEHLLSFLFQVTFNVSNFDHWSQVF